MIMNSLCNILQFIKGSYQEIIACHPSCAYAGFPDMVLGYNATTNLGHAQLHTKLFGGNIVVKIQQWIALLALELKGKCYNYINDKNMQITKKGQQQDA